MWLLSLLQYALVRWAIADFPVAVVACSFVDFSEETLVAVLHSHVGEVTYAFGDDAEGSLCD